MVVCLFASVDSYGWIQIDVTKSGGGIFGYNYVNETFVQTGGNCKYDLQCSGKGWTGCKWDVIDPENPPGTCQTIIVTGGNNGNGLDIAMEHVEAEFESGNSSGTVVLGNVEIENLSGTYESAVVVWSGTSSDDYTFKMYSYSEAQNLGLV